MSSIQYLAMSNYAKIRLRSATSFAPGCHSSPGLKAMVFSGSFYKELFDNQSFSGQPALVFASIYPVYFASN